MKKSKLWVLAVLVLAVLLAACGGTPGVTEPPSESLTDAPTDPPTNPADSLTDNVMVPEDLSGLTYFDLGCGLEMYAAPSMELLVQEGFAVYMADEDQTISILEDKKGPGMTLEDYAASYVDGEKITGFARDQYGNLSATYSTVIIDGTVFQFYVTAKETADSFWLVYCACNERAVDVFFDDYPRWCATIKATE